jgi:hypothetical protein
MVGQAGAGIPGGHAEFNSALILMLDHIEGIPELAPAFPAGSFALLDASRARPAVVAGCAPDVVPMVVAEPLAEKRGCA